MTYLFALLMTFYNFQSEPDCRSLKLGTFKTVNYGQDSIPIITMIERTENYQIEKSESFGVQYKFKIEWINDCSYKLIWLETIKDTNNFGYPTNQILTIEITSIESGFYNQIISSNLFKQKIEGKVEIID
jgi:hypothetical protein